MSLESAITKLIAAVEANTAAVLSKTGSAPVPVVASAPTAQSSAAPRADTAPAADPLANIGATPAAIDILPAAAPLTAVTRDTAIDAAQKVGAQKGRAVLVELFAKFGATSFPQIKETDYAAFVNAAEAALK